MRSTHVFTRRAESPVYVRGCWICALRGGGHGGPVYWFQSWHLNRIRRAI